MSDVVYRMRNADGELLYVGVTATAFATRLTQHLAGRERKKWAEEVTRVDIEHFPDRDSALDAEATAIREENPKHNLTHGTRASRDVIEQRRESRRLNQQRRDEEEAALREVSWRPSRSVTCTNCGDAPDWLPKGLMLSEIECPNCECVTLTREVKR